MITDAIDVPPASNAAPTLVEFRLIDDVLKRHKIEPAQRREILDELKAAAPKLKDLLLTIETELHKADEEAAAVEPTGETAAAEPTGEAGEAAADAGGADEDDEKPARTRRKCVIVISDPERAVSDEARGKITGWVIRLEESDPASGLPERINEAAIRHNGSRNGRRKPVGTFGETVERMSTSTMGECRVWPQTRLPVDVLFVDNALHELAR